MANPLEEIEMRYSAASLDLLYRIRDSAYRRAKDFALRHAREDGREVVTEADVLAGLRTALDGTVSVELESDDAGSARQTAIS